MVEGGGFEPPKDEPSDLQSDPFGHSGTPPLKARHCPQNRNQCQHIFVMNFIIVSDVRIWQTKKC